KGNPLNALDLNTVNLILILLALILHWRPVHLARAFKEGAPAAACRHRQAHVLPPAPGPGRHPPAGA
ncbi:hypothetical protein, partial [Streptomyces cuspidosporus]|uniref:hypothetical protein n=1 Tax=Streptomyces cuspidosporus TaxID=66882 RepID=UPI0031FD31F0